MIDTKTAALVAEIDRLREGFMNILGSSDSEMRDGDFAREIASAMLGIGDQSLPPESHWCDAGVEPCPCAVETLNDSARKDAEVERLTKELAEAKQDAERYRYLRSTAVYEGSSDWTIEVWGRFATIEEAIDKAMRRTDAGAKTG